jgi:ABC-2 type transport system ATP-binding protein
MATKVRGSFNEFERASVEGITDTVVEVDALERYRTEEVLRGVTFRVERGEMFGLLGTTAQARSRLSRSSEAYGEPRAAGGVCSGSTRSLTATRCGGASAASCRTPPCPTGSVGEALRLMASLRPAPWPFDALAAEWRLEGLWKRPVGALSGGERQRLFVSLALIGRPEPVFLDGLTQHLDPVSRRHAWGGRPPNPRRGRDRIACHP